MDVFFCQNRFNALQFLWFSSQNTFINREVIDDFSVVVGIKEIQNKKYSFSAGQYFDIKMEQIDISEEEFNNRINNIFDDLNNLFDKSHELEKEIKEQVGDLKYE